MLTCFTRMLKDLKAGMQLMIPWLIYSKEFWGIMTTNGINCPENIFEHDNDLSLNSKPISVSLLQHKI